MQADSSAKRTCRESRSTSLCTATVRIPISLQVQIIRQAISPRLAIRILRNGLVLVITKVESPRSDVQRQHDGAALDFGAWTSGLLSPDSEKRLAVLHRLPVFDVNLDHFAGGFRLNLIHQLHGFDNTYHRVVFDLTADPHEALRSRRWRPVEGPDY